VEPVPLTVPELPPRPLAYEKEIQQQRQQEPQRENPMHLIYIKSGFYVRSNHSDELTHGFFSIFSKSMVKNGHIFFLGFCTTLGN
jgi:hypothetical protein